ncbi:response regulator transcription factor [Gemella sanguinis]|uniref:response regulator transcription factor n=1 Tax=Gemella sanguinis TaxID=84135 RepID=UPI00352C8D09
MRILLAEDERDLADALEAMLKHNNYSVDTVDNGQDALDYLMLDDYDGAILDVMMPKMDGVSVVQKLRESKKSTPVLLLTAKSEIEDKVYGLDSGADDYLTKPFVIKELLARVRSMTRRQTTFTSNVLELGNVSLSKYTFELSTEKDKVRLSNKEYQMMEMLMRNPGNVIQTEQFLERIWGYDSDSEINVVWVNISYLRKKLKALDANVQIKATRNVGYTLEIVDVQES